MYTKGNVIQFRKANWNKHDTKIGVVDGVTKLAGLDVLFVQCDEVCGSSYHVVYPELDEVVKTDKYMRLAVSPNLQLSFF